MALIKEKFPKYEITTDFLDTIHVNKKSTGVVIGSISFKNVSVEELVKRNVLK